MSTTYIAGADDDHVIKTFSDDSLLDLRVYLRTFKQIKAGLQAIPDPKTAPDQETLDHWMETVYQEGQLEKDRLDDMAVDLYYTLKPIKEAGLIPSKYDTQYNQLKNYVLSL